MQSVYALGDPRTGEVHYIGISQDVYRRYAQHLNHPHINNVKNTWMEEIKQAGIVPTLAILETSVDDTIIHEREKHWIQHYLALGAPLSNIMHGSVLRTHKKPEGVFEANLMQEKPTYTLRELFDNLPIPIKELGRRAGVNEVTVARIRDGNPARRSTINSLLREMSNVYNRPLSLANVTGVSIRGEQQNDSDGGIADAA